MFVSARHIFVAQDRRQTAECPDTNGDKRILKRQGLIGTQRHVFSKNSPYACQRTREQTQANAGADASESGGRDERVWEQTRTHLLPDSLTGIGSRRKDMGAQEADCNAERMASALRKALRCINKKIPTIRCRTMGTFDAMVYISFISHEWNAWPCGSLVAWL